MRGGSEFILKIIAVDLRLMKIVPESDFFFISSSVGFFSDFGPKFPIAHSEIIELELPK